jgi:tRNA (cmo5U34)-methyltransferase
VLTRDGNRQPEENMTEFDKSNWAKAEFSQGYRDNADVFIVERKRMLAILQSFYTHFVKDGARKTVLDLGCGDGIVTSAIAEVDGSLSATLVDGSSEMLKKAGEKLAGLKGARFIQSSFQEMIQKDILKGDFDFIVSSLAIHHLTMEEKASLFGKIYAHLKPGKSFVNIDVVLAPAEALEGWYMQLWKDWIAERKKALGITGGQFDDIIQQYKNAEENKPDTLGAQLAALRSIGFRDVDCYYKYGIFTMYGGSHPPS